MWVLKSTGILSRAMLSLTKHRPLIYDFGSSRVVSSDATLTQSQQMAVYYAAPEFGEGADYDTKVDVYSFRMMLFPYDLLRTLQI